MDPEKMKKIGMKMNILMGISLSFALSLVGNLMSGHFTLPGFLLSFAVSTVICLIIGRFIPIGRITREACAKRGFEEGTTKARLLSALISDSIYTPVMTFIMVLLAYLSAKRGGAPVSFITMFIPSLFISYIIGFALVYVLEPLYLKLVLGKR